MSWADEFDAFAAGDDGPTSTSDAPPTLENEHDAQKMMRALRSIERALGKLDAFVEGERRQLEEFYAVRSGPLHERAAWFRRALEGWMRGQHARDDRIKTVNLPAGTLTLRSPGTGSLAIDNEEAVIKWCEANKVDVLEPKVSVKRGELKKLVQRGPLVAGYADGTSAYAALYGGEKVPGVCFVVATEPTFDAKPKSPVAAVTDGGDNGDATEPQEEQ